MSHLRDKKKITEVVPTNEKTSKKLFFLFLEYKVSLVHVNEVGLQVQTAEPPKNRHPPKHDLTN
jgi:hypothetical protein